MIVNVFPRLRMACLLLPMLGLALVSMNRDATAETGRTSRFYLVGVGPGDPDQITLRAVKTIRAADVIVCTKTPEASKQQVDGYFSFEEKFAEYLQGKELVQVEWFLGRNYGTDPSTLQGDERRRYDEIASQRNEVIARLRKALSDGKTVAVLDTGDPLIYGPHAWYLEEFEDVDPIVVPGVSSFNAANAALRKSVTSSDTTRSVILTAGYQAPGKTDTLAALSVHGCTMVIFTMGTEFKQVIETLAVNYPKNTPVAVVTRAGYADKEEVARGTLETIVGQIGGKLPFEHLIYVGDFLDHRHKKDQ